MRTLGEVMAAACLAQLRIFPVHWSPRDVYLDKALMRLELCLLALEVNVRALIDLLELLGAKVPRAMKTAS